MIFKYLLKYFRDLIRLKFNTDGNSKFGKLIFKIIKKGTYLDVGCYHPIKESQTAFLYKHGWRGFNLDISKQSIDPGMNFGPYGIPKASTLFLMRQYTLEYGKYGIRANGVNADRIRSGILTDNMKSINLIRDFLTNDIISDILNI